LRADIGEKNFWLVLLFLFFRINAQTVEIVKRSTVRPAADERFEFLYTETSLSSLAFVATIKITGKEKNATIPKLFFKARDKARELGGNCFKLVDYKTQPAEEAIMILDLFNAPDEILKTNRSHEEANTLFVFFG